MTSTGKAPNSRQRTKSWWFQRRNRNKLWLALLGVGVIAVIALFLSLQPGGDEGGTSASRSTSIYTFETADLHSLSFDPSNPERLVFGHHGGVMASEDGGKTWKALLNEQNLDGMNLVFDPEQPQTLYLAGHNVFSRSGDAGATWQAVSNNLPGLDLHAFGASPTTLGRFYAFAAGKGIFTSDGGDSTWSPLWTDAPQGTNSIVELSDGTLLVGATDKGILRSEDGGKTWQESRSGIATGVIFAVKGEPAGGRVYAGTSNGLFASSDGGRSWKPTTLDDAQVVVVGVNPDNPDNVMAIDRGGRLYHSTDGGTTWSS